MLYPIELEVRVLFLLDFSRPMSFEKKCHVSSKHRTSRSKEPYYGKKGSSPQGAETKVDFFPRMLFPIASIGAGRRLNRGLLRFSGVF